MRSAAACAVLALTLLIGLFLTLSERSTAQEPAAERISVVVELVEPSVIEALLQAEAAGMDEAARRTATRVQLDRVRTAQSRLAAALAAYDVQEIYRVQRVYNGIALRVDPAQLNAIAELPEVAAIRPIMPKRPTHAVSVPFVGAPALWAGANGGGATGEGVTIAVIDTGIDYLHRDFAGPGDRDVYERNDVTVVGDVAGFPSAKIVGGYDFSGDDYNADPDAADYQPIPAPDPDPYDCYGHGTHVAGTAAGSGVTEAGATYLGPYDADIDLTGMRVAPGVAPRAQLYALKVFGCRGATELTDRAIEWAVDPDGDGDFSDRVDVINLSLGSPFGSQVDPSVLAAERAAALGVVVVASAGNAGDHYYAVGSPGVADGVISVAAASLTSSGQGIEPSMASFSARGPRSGDGVLKPDLAAPGRFIRSARKGSGVEAAILSGTSMAAPHVAGGMALLRQLNPDLGPMELKALAMSAARYPAGAGGPSGNALYGPTRTGAGLIDLPAAAASSVYAQAAAAPEQGAISFGLIDAVAPVTQTQEIVLRNRGALTAVVTPRFETIGALPGATFALVNTETITVAPGTTITVAVRLTADPAALRHVPDGSTIGMAGLPRHWVDEITGFVRLDPADDTSETSATLRLPVHAAVRPVATLVTSDVLPIDADHQGELSIEGAGLTESTAPSALSARISAFELSHSSGDLPSPFRPSIGDPYDYGDLQQIGVTSDITPGRPLSTTTLHFGIVTRAAWSSPSQVELSVIIDVNEDGVDDYRLFNSNAVGYVTDRGFSDTFVSALERLATGERRVVGEVNVLDPDEADTRVFDSRVLVLSVPADLLALNESASRFAYRVEVRIREVNDVYDASPRLTYDVRRPGLTMTLNGAQPLLSPADGGDAIAVALNLAAYGRNRSQGILFISHHNAAPNQARAVSLDLGLPPRFYLPLVQSAAE